MNLSTLFAQINSVYRGSDDNAPTAGDDFSLWLLTTNRKINEWATDATNNWRSQYETRAIGVVTAGVQTYTLDTDFIAPSDSITVTENGINTEITIGEPQDRTPGTAYIVGKQLTFVDTLTASSSLVGGTINVHGYYLPTDMVDATSIVPVDDPYWLVYAVASELAFNDLTYESKAPDLVAKANNLWAKMVYANKKGTAGNPRKVRYNVQRIYGSEV